MKLSVAAYEVPTEAPESDGTAEWDKTTLVVVELAHKDVRGLGYTYADLATARAAQFLTRHVEELSPYDTRHIFTTLVTKVRNHGRGGACAMAISAIDCAAWDLKARLLGVPLSRLLGLVRSEVPAYGSGGFTSLSEPQLCEQLAGWADQGFRSVKMKVGRGKDVERVRAARKAIGRGVELFVDANGAYDRKQALQLAAEFAGSGVTWFEEPVVKTDLEGLRLLRDRCPMEITGGEYAWEPADFRALLPVLDVVQADVTRCGGVTGFLDAHALLSAFELPMSSHCAPSLHVPLGCALPGVRHLEWFFDHQRIERMLFDGAPQPERGMLRPNLAEPGIGLTLKREDAERFRAQI